MPTRRFLALTALLIALTASCATVSRAPDPGPVQYGTLGPEAVAKGSRADGTSWSLSLHGTDVALEVDGAEVLFEDAAPTGRLSYVHTEEAAEWLLHLASGAARCHGRHLEVASRRYRLEDGKSYRFDDAGVLAEVSARP
jgi:hypothetical protein